MEKRKKMGRGWRPVARGGWERRDWIGRLWHGEREERRGGEAPRRPRLGPSCEQPHRFPGFLPLLPARHEHGLPRPLGSLAALVPQNALWFGLSSMLLSCSLGPLLLHIMSSHPSCPDNINIHARPATPVD